MEVSDIQHLARLARIALREGEAEVFAADFESILAYVAQVTVVSANARTEPAVGVQSNVFREDREIHAPGVYTEALLNAAPERHGQYIHVKKILGDTK